MSDAPARCGRMSPEGNFCRLTLGHVGYHSDNIFIWEGDIQKLISEVIPGGANRDPHPELSPANWFSVDYETVRAVAETCHEGDSRYGFENWMKGLPASDLANHAFEHLFKLNSGDNSERHLEHAIWNLGKLLWMANHKPELIDVPAYRRYFGLPPLTDKQG